ncbi:type VI secretion system baseplate subunit TssG [uncultured Spirosoma sp.]|uniref:type VI secretion system baseplate subunit TssG n=1 Tax=uncultured Spirosoma sp. TaxID=278208 RepID=UPI0025837229|nr:type VI secretion system baseplate subunit TssG [uncultured Spirosoma sp.]
MNTLSDFSLEINQLARHTGADIRLEVLLAELMHGGLDPRRDILVYPQGLFARNYRPDVGVSKRIIGDDPADDTTADKQTQFDRSGVWAGPVHVYEDEEPNTALTDAADFLNIPVFRDGLYDYLPEGLFHQPTVDDDRKFAQEIDEQDRRERAARRFFRPLEQEFYRLGVLLELEERKYLLTEENLNQPDQGAVLRSIWGLPADRLTQEPRRTGTGWIWSTKRVPLLDTRQLNNLLYLLPVAHRLVNDRPLVARVFALMLGVPVSIGTIPPQQLVIEPDDDSSTPSAKLGQVDLGNFSLEGIYQDTMPAIEIRLGPLSIDELTGFLPEGPGRAVLDLLIGYFLPAESEIVTHLLPDAAGQSLTLVADEADATSVLGWASYI